MKFGILGPVECWHGDRRLALGGPRQVALLSFLLLNPNRGVSSDAVIEAVWGEDRSGAAKRLTVAIARLRKALEPLRREGEDFLTTVGGGYLLSLSVDDLDAFRFEQMVRDAIDALDKGDATLAGRRLREALGLWRGPALADVRFHDFAQAEVNRLEELRLVALEARVDADLRQGESGILVGELESLLARYPTRERVASQLMLALYRSGRQADALAVYQRVRFHLADELGLEPGPALRLVQAQILEHAPAIGASRNDGEDLAPRRPASAGAVTMVIAEIAHSAALGPESPDRQGRGHLHDVLRRLWSQHPGVHVAEREEGLLAVFDSPHAALEAAVEAKSAPASLDEPGGDIRLRIGVHTGKLRRSAGGYWGEDIHYAGRVAAAAHDGQILVTGSTAALAPEATLVDLGEHRLTDFAVPVRLFGLGPGPHRLPRTSDPLRSNLPGTHGDLIGRDRELADLVTTLTGDQKRLITITGPGGAGKSRIALAVAESLVDALPDGAFFVPLAQVGEADAVSAAIAAALAIHVESDGDASEALGRALADRSLLLVLDNFEHLLEAAPGIGNLMARAPGLRVMVTSQAPLRIRGETVMALGPLEVPLGDDEVAVTLAPASRLLVERARDADPGFQLTGKNAASLARLCRALDGLPLAIELAAARLSLLTPEQLLERLNDGIDALGQGPRDLPARQRGLIAALEWTYGLLDEEQASLLRSLGVFAGPVSLERIERVSAGRADVLDLLAGLVDLSLVTRSGDGRFLLHAGVRDFARAKLALTGEGQEVARRHGEAFAKAAETWGYRLLFDVDEVLSAVLREEADIGQALIWAANSDPERFARLAGGVSMPLLFAARLPLWRETIEQAVARAPVTPKAQPWLLLAASLAAFQAEDVQLARARLASTVESAEESGEPWVACLMGTCSVIFQVLTGVTDGIRDQYARLSAQVKQLGDSELLTLVEGLEPYLLAYCEHRPAEAGKIWASLLAQTGRVDFAAWTAPYCWPDCALMEGDYAAALARFRPALQRARERSQPPTMAYQLEGMAMALSGLGRHSEALEAAGWADSVRQTAGPAVSILYKEMLNGALLQSRAQLGPDEARAAYAKGRASSFEAAVNAALALGQAALD